MKNLNCSLNLIQIDNNIMGADSMKTSEHTHFDTTVEFVSDDEGG